VVEECEEVGSGIHGMNDDVSISVTVDDDEFDHGGCTVGTDDRIARRVFVGIEVELYEGIVKGVADGLRRRFRACRPSDESPSIIIVIRNSLTGNSFDKLEPGGHA
jgi:hypothetical protein